jgi:hypothetical protein
VVLWIWVASDRFILPDRDQLPGHADPDPADWYRYQFQANEVGDKIKLFKTFSRKHKLAL